MLVALRCLQSPILHASSADHKGDAHSVDRGPGPSGRQTPLEASPVDLDPLDPSEHVGNSLYSTSAETEIQPNLSPVTAVGSTNLEEPDNWEDGERYQVTKRSVRADWPSVCHQSKSIESREDPMAQVVSVVVRAQCTGPD